MFMDHKKNGDAIYLINLYVKIKICIEYTLIYYLIPQVCEIHERRRVAISDNSCQKYSRLGHRKVSEERFI